MPETKPFYHVDHVHRISESWLDRAAGSCEIMAKQVDDAALSNYLFGAACFARNARNITNEEQAGSFIASLAENLKDANNGNE